MIDLDNGYRLSTDPKAMQIEAIHAYLARSYWSTGIPLSTVRIAVANSIGVGVFNDGEPVGFGRVTTDRATFAYLADVYVLEDHQGQGLAQAMVKALHDHPELQGLRRWMLATSDAHGVYEKLGWTQVTDAAPFMQRHFPDVYR